LAEPKGFAGSPKIGVFVAFTASSRNSKRSQ